MLRTPEAEHARLTGLARERALPSPPDRPAPEECCARYCDPCIWDYYERALDRWRDRHGIGS